MSRDKQLFKSSLRRTVLAFASLLGLMAVFSATALAAGPPIVTVSAPEKTLHTALMQGNVNANGGTGTTYKFEYGQSKLYGKTTTVKSGSGAVSSLLYGLEPGVTWHYRISATNSLGTTVSEDMQFEMLLTWRVEGKPIWEWPEEVLYYPDAFAGPTVLNTEGKIGGITTKITCEDTTLESGHGHLGKNYDFEFNVCKTFLNGTESKACQPTTPFVVNLNNVMVPPEGTQFKMSVECAIGSKISLNGGGFTSSAITEAEKPSVALTEQLSTYGGLKTTISHPAWFLTAGLTKNKKFGIS